MNWRTLLKVTGVWWFLPAATSVGFLIASANSELTLGYGPERASRAFAARMLAAPVVALAAAVTASRLRGYQSRLASSARNPIRKTGGLWLTTVLGGFTAVALAAFLAARTAVDSDTPLWWLLVAAHMFAATAVGCLIGSRLRLILGAPLALAAAWAPPAFLPAFTPVWLRFTVGPPVGDCCAPSEVISRPVLLAGILMFIGIAALCMALAPRWLVGSASLTAAASLVAALGLGSSITLAHGRQTPTQARTDPLTCTSSSPTLCWWPDGASETASVLPTLRLAQKISTTTGAPLPARIVPGAANWPQSSLTLGYTYAPNIVKAQLAAALVPQPPQVCGDLAIFTASEAARLWWANQLGVQPLGSPPPGSTEQSKHLAGLTREQRSRVMSQNNIAITTCDAKKLTK